MSIQLASTASTSQQWSEQLWSLARRWLPLFRRWLRKILFEHDRCDVADVTCQCTACASKQQTIVPDHRTESTLAPLRRQWFEAEVGENQYTGTPGTTITFDRAHRPYFADVFGVRDNDEPIWDVDHTMRIDLQGVFEHFPEIRMPDVSVITMKTQPSSHSLQTWNTCRHPRTTSRKRATQF